MLVEISFLWDMSVLMLIDDVDLPWIWWVLVRMLVPLLVLSSLLWHILISLLITNVSVEGIVFVSVSMVLAA